MNKKKIILIAVSIAVVAGAGFWLFGSSKAQHKVTYETAVVTRGEISESITATGDHRTGDGSGSRHAGQRHHRQDICRL